MKKVTRRLQNKDSIPFLVQYLEEYFEKSNHPIRIVLEQWSPNRSLPQNATVHMWFQEIAEQVGDTMESVKSDIKELAAPKVEGPLGVMRCLGTSEMSTSQMNDFMTHIQVMSVDYGWDLTQP